MSKFGIIGDSITKGTDYGGVTTTDTFTYILGSTLGYAAADIVNAGVSANTSGQMLERLQADIIDKGVTVCGIMAGINDMDQSVLPTTYASNLRSIGQALADNNIKAVFISPPLWRSDEVGHTENREYLYALESVAIELGAPFIDCYRYYAFDYLCNSAQFDSWYAPGDLIHQSKDGHARLAAIMFKPMYSGHFQPLPAPPTASVEALSLACADYLIGGQTPALLATVQTERNKFS